MPQPISKSAQRTNRATSLFFLFGTIMPLGLVFASLTLDGISSFEFHHAGTIFIGLISLGLCIFLWNIKTELTIEEAELGAQQAKEFEEEFWSRWYVRYVGSIFMLALAYACFIAWNEDIRIDGLRLIFISPVVGIICAIIAIVNAWELSVFCIIIGFGYLLFIGVAMLPVSISIIIGSLIIAYAVKRYKIHQD